MSASKHDLTCGEARRIAIAAQGLDRPRPAGRAGTRAIRRTIRRLGLLQLDYVKVVLPSHYQVLFSRVGPYRLSLLDDLVYGGREFTEQWAHEASVVPMELWPLLRHRREIHTARPRGFAKFIERNPQYLAWVLSQVEARGPLAAADLDAPDGVARKLDHAWFGTVPRAVLEHHFGRGRLAVTARRADLSRTFDLSERVIPREQRDRRVGREEAQRELLAIAARAHGIGVAADLADYVRMPVREARPRLAELVAAGRLEERRVEGWRDAALLDASARIPRRIRTATLLSPFDPLIWYRPRTKRLFGFDYRFEIFLPEAKRRWGCYVLPFLVGDRLVARVDLKTDRPASRLRVVASFVEPGAEPGSVASALVRELRAWAGWLELDSVVVGRRGNLARPLAAAIRS